MKLSEARSVHVSCVYKLVFPNGKCYVGQTKDLGDRVKLYESKCRGSLAIEKLSGVDEAIKEFGIENVVIEVLCELKMSNHSDLLVCLSILEIKYIRDLKTLVPDGYNHGVGGEVLGMPIEFFGALSGVDLPNYQGSKPVLRYSLDGEFVEEYPSIEKCAYALGVDSKDVSNMLASSCRVFRGRHILMYKRYGEVPPCVEPYKPEYIERTKVVTNVKYKDVYRERVIIKPGNPILKYNMDGEYCGTYESCVDAALSIGRNGVTKGGIHRGYLFLEHDGGEIEQNIGKISKKEERCPLYSEFLVKHRGYLSRRAADVNLNGEAFGFEYDRGHEWESLINDFLVGQYTLNGELVAIHEGIRGASRATGINYANIWANVMGRTKKSNGYRWSKCDENGVPLKMNRVESGHSGGGR